MNGSGVTIVRRIESLSMYLVESRRTIARVVDLWSEAYSYWHGISMDEARHEFFELDLSDQVDVTYLFIDAWDKQYNVTELTHELQDSWAY